MSRSFLFFVVFLLATPTHAQEQVQRGVAATHDSAGGMRATILVTPDRDWQEKWNTPQETLPYFNETSGVATGGSLFLITFFENPGIDTTGKSDLRCDMSLVASDGTLAMDEHDVDCFSREAPIEPDITYMTDTTISFEPDGTEPKGRWTYRVTIRDRIGGGVFPLEASFTVN